MLTHHTLYLPLLRSKTGIFTDYGSVSERLALLGSISDMATQDSGNCAEIWQGR